MTAELREGATKLFAAGLWYPGAALVRQLIECVYLITLMGERHHEAESWITSSRQQVLSTFMPRQMRQRSVRNFRLAEYSSHWTWAVTLIRPASHYFVGTMNGERFRRGPFGWIVLSTSPKAGIAFARPFRSTTLASTRHMTSTPRIGRPRGPTRSGLSSPAGDRRIP